MSYSRLWHGLRTLVVTTGVGVAMLAWSPLVCVTAVGLTAVLVLVVLELMRDPPAGPDAPAAPASPRRETTLRDDAGRALAVAGGLATLAVLLELSPPVTLALLLLLALSSPPVVARLGRLPATLTAPPRRPRSRPPAGSADTSRRPAAIAPDEPADGLPDGRGDDGLRGWDRMLLCHQLRRTFWALQTATDPEEQLRLVTVRQRIFDELARRDPAAMERWLQSGARASGSPEKFFTAEPGAHDADSA